MTFPGPIAEREAYILAAAHSQRAAHDWYAITVTHAGRELALSVSRDAMRIDDVRVTVSAATLWSIATALGALPLTPRLADIIHARASVVVSPVTRTWWRDGSMATTARMVEQSHAVDDVVGSRRALVSGQCKDWVLCRIASPRHAANYGWHVERGGYSAVTMGMRVLQPLSTAHDWHHTDYSQGIRLVSRAVAIDGMSADLVDVLTNPELAGALSHEGPLTKLDPRRAAVPAPPPPSGSSATMPSVRVGDVDGVAFVPARHYTPAHRTAVDLVVMHDMEAAEKRSTAETVARWFASARAPKASCHYCVDSDSVVQCVREYDVAWHAPHANRIGIGIEHAGYARQTAAQWLDDYGRNMLARSAELVAGICHRWGIPIVRLTPEQVRSGARGICGHDDVTSAYAVAGGHWDPGPHFPWTWYIEQVRKL